MLSLRYKFIPHPLALNKYESNLYFLRDSSTSLPYHEVSKVIVNGSLKLSIRLQRPSVARVDFLSSELTKIKKHYNSFDENRFKYEVTLRRIFDCWTGILDDGHYIVIIILKDLERSPWQMIKRGGLIPWLNELALDLHFKYWRIWPVIGNVIILCWEYFYLYHEGRKFFFPISRGLVLLLCSPSLSIRSNKGRRGFQVQPEERVSWKNWRTKKKKNTYILNQRDEESMSTIWDSILTKTSNARIDTNVTDEDLGDSSTLKSDVGDVEA